MRKSKIFLLLIILLLNNNTFSDTISNSITENKDTELMKEINKQLSIGDYSKDNNNILLADESYKHALKLAKKNNNLNYEYTIFVRFGLLYERIGNYNLSIKNHVKALNIAEALKDEKKKARSYNNLGNILFIFEHNYDKAYEYFMKSASIDKKLKNYEGIAGTYNNIGEIYRYQEQYDKALEYYKKAITINTRMKNDLWLAINYENIGSVYFMQNEKEKSLEYFTKALKHANIINDHEGLASINNNIGELYLSKNNINLALTHLLVSYDYAEKISSTTYIKDVAYNLSELFNKTEDYKNAYLYFKVYENAETKLNKNLKTRRIAQIVAEYQLEKKNKEIEFFKKQNEFDILKEYALILIVILVVVIGLLMFTRLRARHKKTKELLKQKELIINTEKVLAETELKNIELEKRQLNQRLNYQKKELVNFALHIIHKNDFLVSVKNELKKIKSTDKETAKQVRSLLLKINQSQKINLDLEEFQQNVERANKDFFDALNNKFPSLTPNEKRLSALLRIDLSSKEIASLNNISIKAVEMGRYRLRKKLDLGTNDSLSDFFRSIVL